MTLRTHFLREVKSLGLPEKSGPSDPVTDAELTLLPEVVQRYMRFMGVLEHPRDWSFRLGWVGRFRRNIKQPWLKCEAWQYNSSLAVARIMHLRIRFGGFIPVVGRDTYLEGRGRMHIKLLGRLTVVDGIGEEYDIGELVTYLNDAVLIAPSMLLVPEVSWSEVDSNSFDVALTDRGHTVSARVIIDARGAPQDFSTTDRFLEDPEHPGRLIRGNWTTPVAEWTDVDGRPVPAAATAVWRLPEGDFPYAEFRLDADGAAFNVAPGA